MRLSNLEMIVAIVPPSQRAAQMSLGIWIRLQSMRSMESKADDRTAAAVTVVVSGRF